MQNVTSIRSPGSIVRRLRASARRVVVALSISMVYFAVNTEAVRPADNPMPAHIVVIKPGKLIKVLGEGTVPVPVGAPDVQGATLTVSGTTGAASYSLLAGGWSRTNAGWEFDDGVCKAQIKYDPTGTDVTKLKAKCKGSTGTLAVPDPGPVDAMLTINNSPLNDDRYCFTCGGTPKGNPDSLFKAKDCDAPPSCSQSSGSVCCECYSNAPPRTCSIVATELDCCMSCGTIAECSALTVIGPPGSHCGSDSNACGFGTCGDSPYPTCGGSCPSGQTCQAVALGVGSGFGACDTPNSDVTGCECVPSSQTCSTTLDCGCGNPTGHAAGVCPTGQACVLSGGTALAGCPFCASGSKFCTRSCQAP